MKRKAASIALTIIVSTIALSFGFLKLGPVPARQAQQPPEYEAKEYEDPRERDAWFWDQRTYPLKTIPVEAHQAAMRAEILRGRMEQVEQAGAPSWTELGPAPLKNLTLGGTRQDASGRALNIAIHPTNNNIVLLGTAQGGIWRSTDGGATFNPVAENQPSLAVKAIRFAPGNPSVVYAGTGEPHSSTSIFGVGVLKSTDAGQTWQALPMSGNGWSFQYTAVSGLQVDPVNADIVYATTAIVGSATDQFNPPFNGLPQTGIFKSVDGGATWSRQLAATAYLDDVGFLDLEMGSSTLLYATEIAGGIYRTTDAGATWTRVTPLKSATVGGELPASVPSYSHYNGQTGHFTTYPRLLLPNTISDFRRIEIGVSAANPDIIYAGYELNSRMLLDVNGNGIFDEGTDIQTSVGLIFKSSDSGQTWSWLGDWPRNGVPNYCGSQCGYDNTVVVNPTNASDVLIGGSANYNRLWPDPLVNPTRVVILPWRGMVHRSLDGGATWIDTTPHCGTQNYLDTRTRLRDLPQFFCSTNDMDPTRVIHPDIQNATFEPGTGRFYVTSDGGLNRGSVVAGGSAANSLDYRWENLNAGIATLQFYFFDVHPTNPELMLGGLQDNAMAYYAGQRAWDSWGQGDGTIGGFDPVNPNIVYYGSQYAVYRHDSGGARDFFDEGWIQILSQHMFSGESVGFIPNFKIDPVQPNNVYATTTTSLYRSNNRGGNGGPENWTRLGAVSGGTTIAVSPRNNQLVWVGSRFGRVLRFDGSSLADATKAPLPGRHVSKVEASPVDANTVFVSFSGYNSNTPDTPGKIFVSTNAGASWTNISGNLPDVPVSALALDPGNVNRIWAGSDVGVFVTTDGGTTWSSLRQNMPVVAIMDMKYNPTTGFLTVATHGRGAWRLRP